MSDSEDSGGIYEHLQLIALEEHLHPNESAFFRKLCRWFSATFHTSILDTEQQPMEYILRHYFEYKLENMSEIELEQHKRLILYKEKVDEEEKDDDEFAEKLELEFIKSKQKQLNSAIKDVKKQISKAPIPELPPDINLKF
jgi:hypothetical protein